MASPSRTARSRRRASPPSPFSRTALFRGLTNREVYWVTTQAHNRFGDSVTTDPEFVIPVASPGFSAETTQHVIAQSEPVVVQVTGVVANSEGHLSHQRGDGALWRSASTSVTPIPSVNA